MQSGKKRSHVALGNFVIITKLVLKLSWFSLSTLIVRNFSNRYHREEVLKLGSGKKKFQIFK